MTTSPHSTATQRTIPIDRIDRDPDQPRTIFDEAALQALATSIRQVGQLQPITVRYVPATRRYRIIMGERRWRAAQIAGQPAMTAVVLTGGDESGDFAKAIAENVGRADMTPLEEARAYQRALDSGYDIPTIASIVGRSPEVVGYRLDLLQLTEAATEALSKGHLPVGTAWYVAKLSPDQQAAFLTKWVRGEFASVRDAEAYAQACRTFADQGGLFDMVMMTEEERATVRARRRHVTTQMERLAGAGEVLLALARLNPADLAQALAGAPGGVGGYQTRVQHLRDAASKCAATLRRAAAVAAVNAPELDIQDDSTLLSVG